MADLGYPGAVVRAVEPAFQAAIAEVREAGLNIMMSMKGDGKPVSFIEDCAVFLPDLADYTERLNAVFERHGTKGTWYAHASVGCLHVRPVLNMKDPADVATMRAIAEECFSLVREYKGSHSGEHGDGIARSEFHDANVRPAHRRARSRQSRKHSIPRACSIPAASCVRRASMTAACFAIRPTTRPRENFVPKLDWSAWPGALGGMLGAVEMCNNNGTCRRLDAEVMCPSFRVTARRRARDARPRQYAAPGADRTARRRRDGERRGRRRHAAVRLVQGVPARMPDRRRHGEDENRVAGGARRSARHPAARPVRGGAAAYRAARVAAAGAVQRAQPQHRAASPERHVGFAAERRFPTWRRDIFRNAETDAAPAQRDVFLFADTFNRYFEPENLRAALSVLRAAGVRAVLPPGRPLCCGRTFLSAGMVDRARAEARRTLAAFAGRIAGYRSRAVLPVHAKDEFPALLPGAEARALADRAMLLSEFFAQRKTGARIEGSADDGARARTLPPEEFRRVPRRRRRAAAGARIDGQADRVLVLRHGRRVRLSGGDAGRVESHGRSRAAAGSAGRGAGRDDRRRRHLVPTPDS